MDRELKKQIKEDEFVSGFQQAAAWVGSHRDEVRLGGGVALLVAVVAGAVFYYTSHRREEAALAFAEAFEVWNAPVVAELPQGADKPTGLSFATTEEKYKRAAAAFEGIERRYPSLAVARRAKYFGALSRVELRDFAPAEKALRELAAERDAATDSALARLALAELYRSSGELDKAIDAYRQYAGDAAVPTPRDYALMSLASTQEEAKKPAEARASYERLVQEFPASVYAAEARRRADFLDGHASS